MCNIHGLQVASISTHLINIIFTKTYSYSFITFQYNEQSIGRKNASSNIIIDKCLVLRSHTFQQSLDLRLHTIFFFFRTRDASITQYLLFILNQSLRWNKRRFLNFNHDNNFSRQHTYYSFHWNRNECENENNE